MDTVFNNIRLGYVRIMDKKGNGGWGWNTPSSIKMSEREIERKREREKNKFDELSHLINLNAITIC